MAKNKLEEGVKLVKEFDLEKSISGAFFDFWNFSIFTVDKNDITVGNLCVGLVLFILGFIFAKILSKRLVKKVFQKSKADVSTRHVFQSLSFYVLLIFMTLFALKMANIPLTVFTLLGGALAIGLGFGSQNIVNNFISGLVILFERPIKVGDFVEIDNIFGKVEHIGMRSTQIISIGNKHLIVPNSHFLEKNVQNWTYADRFIRLSIKVGVHYSSEPDEVESTLLEAVNSSDRIYKEKKAEVFFNDFGSSSLDFEVFFWLRLQDLVLRRKLESEMRFKIQKLFKEKGIVVAYPQMDLHVQPDLVSKEAIL